MCSIFDMVEHAAHRGFFDSFLCVLLGKCTYLEKRILNVNLETDTLRQMADYMVWYLYCRSLDGVYLPATKGPGYLSLKSSL